MPLCPKCGSDNALGRIFCASCGEKLDLSRMSSEEVAASFRQNWFKRNKWIFYVVPATLVVFMILLALWPRTSEIGQRGTLHGGDRVRKKVRALSMIKRGETIEFEISEKDLNGYIEYVRGRSLGAKRFWVDIGSGYMRVRLVKPLLKLKMFGRLFEPRISYDVLYVPAGDRLVPKKASMGRLSLGLAKGIAAKKVQGLVKRHNQWSLVSNPESIKITDEKLALSYAP